MKGFFTELLPFDLVVVIGLGFAFILGSGTSTVQLLKQYWLWILGAISIFLIIFALWMVPKWQLASLPPDFDLDKRIDLENKNRTTLAQIIGGLVILIGLFFTWQTVQSTRKTVELTQKSLELTQEGQVTERFTRAIDQLGNPKLEIRLGGIYALERIARDSEKDHWSTMEVLTAYVRENAYWKEQQPPKEDQIRKLAPDIQAILTVLGRRPLTSEEGKNQHLDLAETDLRGASLNEAHLEGASLIGVHFEGASLVGAHLEGASLIGVTLEGADLTRANLKEAILYLSEREGVSLSGNSLKVANLKGALLSGANLERAYLPRANLEGANLKGASLRGVTLNSANLEGANLNSSNLEGAHIPGVNFEGADLSYANLRGADITEASFKGTHLEFSNLEGINLSGNNLEGVNLFGANLKGANLAANLEGANFNGAHLKDANLNQAHLKSARYLTIEQLCGTKTLYKAILDPYFVKQVQKNCPQLLEEPKTY